MEAPVDPLGNFKRAFQLEVPPDKQPTTEIQASKMKWKFLQAYPQRDPQYRSVFFVCENIFPKRCRKHILPGVQLYELSENGTVCFIYTWSCFTLIETIWMFFIVPNILPKKQCPDENGNSHFAIRFCFSWTRIK